MPCTGGIRRWRGFGQALLSGYWLLISTLASGQAPAAPAPPAIPQMPALPQAPPPGDAAAAAEKGFVVVEVDLGARKFDKKMPFDEPFILKGKVPAGTKLVGIQYAVSTEKVALKEFKPNWQPSPPFLWHHLPELDQPDEQGRLTFRVLMQPLEARRYYQFRFWITPTLTQTTEFAKKAARTVSESLEGTLSDSLNNEEAQALQGALIADLTDVTYSGDMLPGETVFDGDGSAVALPELKTFAEAALQPQIELREAWGKFLAVHAERDQQLALVHSTRVVEKLLDVTRKSNELLTQYATLEQRYLNQAPTGGATDVNLEELLTNLRDQVNRYVRITTILKPYPALVENGQKALADAREAEDRFLEQAGDVVAIREVTQLFTSSSRVQVDAVIEANRVLERALTAFQTFLAAPEMDELLQELAGTKDIAEELTVQNRTALRDLASEDGPLMAALHATTSLQRALRDTQSAVNRRQDAVAALVKDVQEAAHSEVLVLASTADIVETERKPYVSADLGVLYAPSLGKALPTVGVNLYFRPVNKHVPLSQKGSFLRRFALTAGVTLGSVADGDEMGNGKTRDDLFLDRAAFLGAGFRITGSIRLGFGTLFLLKQDDNPLVDDTSLALSPYGSAAIDINVKEAASDIGKMLGGIFK